MSQPNLSNATAPELPQAALDAMAAPRAPDAPRRCFICLTDEDPSDPPGSWVDPCPCTLEAHQDCMLSWVTDCERSSRPLQCPVCKSMIEMEGPRDPIVLLSDAIQRRFTRASPFMLFTSVSMGVQFSLQMYGAMALWTFSGKDALLRFMLGPDLLIDGRFPGTMGFAKERIWNALVLMNIAPALLGGQLLPGLSNKIFLPSGSLYGIYHFMHDEDFFTWPPSPQLALAAFPYIRSVYHTLWRELVQPYEIKLNRQILGLPEVAPRPAEGGANNRPEAERNGEGGFFGFLQNLLDALDPEDDEQIGGQGVAQMQAGQQGANAGQQGGEGGMVVEVVIEEVVEEVDEQDGEGRPADDADAERQEERIPEPQPAEPVPEFDAEAIPRAEQDVAPANQDGHQNDAAGQDPAAQANQNHEAPPAPPARRLGLGGILSSVSNAIVTALILPGISFAVGEALRLALPKAWTTAAVAGRRGPWGMHYAPAGRPGFLQQQWGRSLVGGCLYVVLKDAARVYAKSRRVVAMKNRRVKNVERERRKGN